jgi:hypothetical protein
MYGNAKMPAVQRLLQVVCRVTTIAAGVTAVLLVLCANRLWQSVRSERTVSDMYYYALFAESNQGPTPLTPAEAEAVEVLCRWPSEDGKVTLGKLPLEFPKRRGLSIDRTKGQVVVVDPYGRELEFRLGDTPLTVDSWSIYPRGFPSDFSLIVNADRTGVTGYYPLLGATRTRAFVREALGLKRESLLTYGVLSAIGAPVDRPAEMPGPPTYPLNVRQYRFGLIFVRGASGTGAQRADGVAATDDAPD